MVTSRTALESHCRTMTRNTLFRLLLKFVGHSAPSCLTTGNVLAGGRLFNGLRHMLSKAKMDVISSILLDHRALDG